MDTKTEVRPIPPPVVDDGEQAAATHTARLTGIGVGQHVLVTALWCGNTNEVDMWLWRVGEIDRIDQSDPRLTFYVKPIPDRADSVVREGWVHAVADLGTVWGTEPEGGVIEVKDGEVAGLTLEADALQTALEAQKQRVVDLESELAEFRSLVRSTAIEVAEAQRWCRPGLNETLGALGLPKVGNGVVTFTVTKTWEMRGAPAGKVASGVSTEWLESSLTWSNGADPGLDNDWEGCEVNESSIEVTITDSDDDDEL